MRTCTYPECAAWCAAHGYPTRDFGYSGGPDPIVASRALPEPYLSAPDFRFVEFSIPADANSRVALAKNLVALLDPDVELLVQIGDWAVWPSGQHMPLFERFRAAFGEHRPLMEAPGQVLAPTERDDAVSILAIAVLFLWNCHVLSARGDQAVFVSHDEYGWFAARGERGLEEATTFLKWFGVLREARAGGSA